MRTVKNVIVFATILIGIALLCVSCIGVVQNFKWEYNEQKQINDCKVIVIQKIPRNLTAITVEHEGKVMIFVGEDEKIDKVRLHDTININYYKKNEIAEIVIKNIVNQ